MKWKDIKRFYLNLDKKIPLKYNLYIERHKNNKLTLKKIQRLKIKQILDYKPTGLWSSEPYSNKQSWIYWCITEKMLSFIEPKNSLFYVIKINFTKILTIDTIDKLKKFHKKYNEKFKECKYVGIRWDKVAKKYNGINFNPYFIFDYTKPKNKKYLWYSMLDCQCQCVWNGKSVNDFYRIK